jgi:hypothetical protein
VSHGDVRFPKLFCVRYLRTFNWTHFSEIHETDDVQQHRRNRSSSSETNTLIEQMSQELLPFLEQRSLKMPRFDSFPGEQRFDHISMTSEKPSRLDQQF